MGMIGQSGLCQGIPLKSVEDDNLVTFDEAGNQGRPNKAGAARNQNLP
jgi:hypothetical protein